MFSDNRGHSVYCGVDKPLIFLGFFFLPTCLTWCLSSDMHQALLGTAQWDSQLHGKGSHTGSWHLKPTCPKTSSFVFLPDLLLQKAHACSSTTWKPVLFSSIPSQVAPHPSNQGQLGSESVSLSPRCLPDATAFLEFCCGQCRKGKCREMGRVM